MKKKNKSALIIGANIGKKIHYKILKKFYSNVFVVGKKKNNNSLKKNNNYKEILSNFTFEHISVCTTYKVQEDFIKFFLSNKIKVKTIMFEKPMTNNIKILNKLKKYCLKKKIKIRVNYTFNELDILKKIIKIFNNTESRLIYTFNFDHPYYKNKLIIWKNKSSEGGGIINYYLSHILFYFENFKVSKKNIETYIKTRNNKLIKIHFKFNKKLELICNPSFNKKLQKIYLVNKLTKVKVNNVSNEWFGRFKIETTNNNNKESKFVKKESIINLTYKNYKKLFNKKFVDLQFVDYFEKVYNCSRNINKIKRKINKNVFEKVQIL